MLNGPSYSQIDSNYSHVVLLLHGVGADGENLIDLSQYLSESLPNALFIAPNAPEAYDGGEVGGVYPGYQWFSLWNRDLPLLLLGLDAASRVLAQYIEDLSAELNIPTSKFILVGFSQGAMVSVNTALTHPNLEIPAVVAFSGGMLDQTHNIATTNPNTQYCFIHGLEDPIVPFSRSERGHQILTQNARKSQFHLINGLEHSIDPRAINFANLFLKKIAE